jgi:Flp pilus assembly protein TadG
MRLLMVTKCIAARMWVSVRRFKRDRGNGIRGVVAIEFAMIAMMLIIMTIGTVDMGMGFYRKMEVQNAAQAGARYAMVKGFDVAGIAAAVSAATTYTDIVASEPSTFYGCPSATGVTTVPQNTVCPDGTQAGEYVTVSTSATYSTILPLPLFPSSFDFGAQSTVRLP